MFVKVKGVILHSTFAEEKRAFGFSLGVGSGKMEMREMQSWVREKIMFVGTLGKRKCVNCGAVFNSCE